MFRIEKIARIRILQHLVFWSIAVYFLLRNFKTSSELAPTDYIYTGVFSVFLIVAVYINLLILVPQFFHESRYGFYILFLVTLLGLITYGQIALFDFIVEHLFPGYYLISYFDYWETLNYFIIFIGLTSLFHFSKSWFLYKESEANLIEIRKEKVEAELTALKNQINPHFLFNSLNSIYAMVLNKSDLAPDALIKLSDAMRYVIYESNHEHVDLQKEIDFIENYIELQRLRMSAKDSLKFNVIGEIHHQKIAPLLLIPIIENCFKYGIKGETEESYVDIKIEIDEQKIAMSTNNNIGFVYEVERSKPKGTGLQNLKKRLELIYPDKHALIIEKLSNSFLVNLMIEL